MHKGRENAHDHSFCSIEITVFMSCFEKLMASMPLELSIMLLKNAVAGLEALRSKPRSGFCGDTKPQANTLFDG